MRWIAMILAIVEWLTLVAGCGGGLSQEDMRRHAIRRPSDDKSNNDKPTPPEQRCNETSGKAKRAAGTTCHSPTGRPNPDPVTCHEQPPPQALRPRESQPPPSRRPRTR